MARLRRTYILAFLIVPALHSPQAQAQQGQLARSFVSAATGNDANDCNRLTPCRTFQRAHDNTFDQGEITVLDSGGYGAVTIIKSISIINDGVGEAGVLVSGGATGIHIEATNASYVSLRGLTIQGIGFGGGQGLLFNRGFALTITNCAIRNLTSHGINVFALPAAQLAVSNSLIADNGGDGIFVQGDNPLRIDLNRVEVRNNSGAGANFQGASGGTHVSIAGSVFSGNLGDGILARGFNGNPSTVVITDSVLSNNAVTNGTAALTAIGVAFIAVGQSNISGNVTTWSSAAGGTVWSFGDNYVLGNFDNDPAMTVIAKK